MDGSVSLGRKAAVWVLALVCAQGVCAAAPLSSGPLALPGLTPVQALTSTAAALSSDGLVALIGAPLTGLGAVYVYTKTGGKWQAPVSLSISGLPASADIGHSVALSADGTVALVGAPFANSNAGAAYVFTYSGGSWSSGVALDTSAITSVRWFGYSVSLSSDGTVAVIGAPLTNAFLGGVYVYTFSGGVWSGPTFMSTSGIPTDSDFGTSVSVDSAGDEILAGAPGSTSSTGKAYIYTLSAGVWSPPTALTATGASNGDEVGASVALSGDGLTAVVGAPFTNSHAGAAYGFTRSSGTWSGSAALSDSASSGDEFGQSVAISSDGSLALVAAPFADSTAGIVYRYAGSSGTWGGAQPLATKDVENNAALGFGVALSADGTVALAPATGDVPGYVYATPLEATLTAAPFVSPATPEQQSTFFIFVSDTDPTRSATNVVVTDVLPAGSSYVSSTPQSGTCSYAPGIRTLTCKLGTLLPGNDTITGPLHVIDPQVSLTIKTPASGGVLQDQVSVVADQVLSGPVTVDASLVNDVAPTAVAGQVTTDAGRSVSGSLTAKPGYTGQALTYALVAAPSHGTVKLTDTSKGTFTYQPAAGSAVQDFFKFSVTDGSMTSKSADETILITAPSSSGGASSGGGGGSFGWLACGVLAWLGRRSVFKRRRY